jgi:hypothetical protein
MGLWRYLESGGKRSVVLAHRRWGKDEVALHRTAIAAHERVAEYWHCLPLFVQARKAIWAAINPHTGRRRIDEAFPKEIRASTNETEMRITFKNGSAWRVVGSDNPDSLVGTAPAGIIFSEWALAAPSAWAYLAPILEENNGWAMFISTPRGRNHLHSMYKMAQTAPGWSAFFSSVVESGFPIDRVEAARAEYTAIFGDDAANALIDQEYYCSFDAAILGSYYGRALAKALAEGRTGQKFGAEPGYPIHRAWDLGIGDSMAIWFFQVIGREIRLLAYYEADGMGMDHYAEVIRQKMSIRGGIDYVPHDARVRELLSGGKTRVEGMKLLGLNPRVIGIHKVEDGINAVRRILPRCIWHERAEPGLEKMRHYRKEWDEDKRVFKNTPLHDFSSHCADAFRALAIAYEEVAVLQPAKPRPQMLITPEGVAIPDGQITIDNAWNLPASLGDNPLGYD